LQRQNKTNKAVRYDNILLSVHTITEAKQYAGLGRAEPGLEPGRWIFQPFDPARPGVAPSLLISFKVFLGR